jgi:hypothetical protein
MLFKKINKKDIFLSHEDFIYEHNPFITSNIILYDDCYIISTKNIYTKLQYNNDNDKEFLKRFVDDSYSKDLYIKTTDIKEEIIDIVLKTIMAIHICCFVNVKEFDFVKIKFFNIEFKLKRYQHLSDILNIQDMGVCTVICFEYDNNGDAIILENLNNVHISIGIDVTNLNSITVKNCNIGSIFSNKDLNTLNIIESTFHGESDIDNCNIVNVRSSNIKYYIRIMHSNIINIFNSTIDILKCLYSGILIINENKITKLDLFHIKYIKFKNINEIKNILIRDSKTLKINPYNIKKNASFNIEKTYISNFKFYYLKTAAKNLFFKGKTAAKNLFFKGKTAAKKMKT